MKVALTPQSGWLPRRLPLACCLLLAAIGLGACDSALTFLAGETHGGLAASHWTGDRCSASSASFITARTEPEWQAVWGTIGQPVPGPLPHGKMAVAVFLGQRFEPGAGVEISQAEIHRRVGEPERPIVTYRVLTAPAGTATVPPDQTADQAVSPWAVRLMDDSVLAPDFQQAGE